MGGWSGPSGACSAAVGGAVGSDFFFHEYGRRVGGVPRSSLKKERKHNMMMGNKTPEPPKTEQK